MDISVLNKSFARVGIVDVFESLIWIERYNKYGEFELYTNVRQDLLALLQPDYYLQIPGSDRTMIVEAIGIKTDPEKGNKLVFKGRSTESILDRRIVFNQIQFTNVHFQDAVWQLLNDAFIIPSVNPPFAGHRIVPNMIFEYNSDPNVVNPTVTTQFFGDNIYDVIEAGCAINSLGFRLLLTSDNYFVFKLYGGQARTYDQSTNPYVVFSPKFDNLINSDYFWTKSNFKTSSMYIGDSSDGVVIKGFHWIYGGAELYGIDHRERLVDLSHISKFVEGTSTPIDLTLYRTQINYQAGQVVKAENTPIEEFDGQADTTNSFKYRTDFFLGDTVQVENEYGLSGKSRVTEVTISENLSGYYVYPTFEKI